MTTTISTQFDQVLADLSERFQRATRGLRNNSRGTALHRYQVEYMYYVHEIVSGPSYIAPKIIDNCNRFIDNIIKNRKEDPVA